MSKATDQLRDAGIYNAHNLVRGKKEDYVVSYYAYSPRQIWSGWYLSSPKKKWPGARYHHGSFWIQANGAKDIEKALALAAKECGVTHWAPSPFQPRTEFVPVSALTAHGIKPSRIIEVLKEIA